MENRAPLAVDRHHRGYNCAQAVICTYCELFGMDESSAFRFAEGFGGGMGGMQSGTCGAVTAMYMLAGLKGSRGNVENGLTKQDTYAQVRALSETFQKRNGTTVCRDLLGLTGPDYFRPCDECISDACQIIEDLLVEKA